LFFNEPEEAPAAEDDEDWEEEAAVPTIIWLCVNDDRPAEEAKVEEEQLLRRCRCRCRCR